MSNSTSGGDDGYGADVDPWDITLVDDLMVHCHEHFIPQFDELYIDMLSACVSGTSVPDIATTIS